MIAYAVMITINELCTNMQVFVCLYVLFCQKNSNKIINNKREAKTMAIPSCPLNY